MPKIKFVTKPNDRILFVEVDPVATIKNKKRKTGWSEYRALDVDGNDCTEELLKYMDEKWSRMVMHFTLKFDSVLVPRYNPETMEQVGWTRKRKKLFKSLIPPTFDEMQSVLSQETISVPDNAEPSTVNDGDNASISVQ